MRIAYFELRIPFIPFKLYTFQMCESYWNLLYSSLNCYVNGAKDEQIKHFLWL